MHSTRSADWDVFIGASLSKPHTSDTNGMSDCLWTIIINHVQLVNSSIDNLKYTKNSCTVLLTTYIVTEMVY